MSPLVHIRNKIPRWVIWLGILIYLNADNDIAGMLGKPKVGGGETLTPKTKLSDQFGFIAVFLDTEGNSIALHTLKRFSGISSQMQRTLLADDLSRY